MTCYTDDNEKFCISKEHDIDIDVTSILSAGMRKVTGHVCIETQSQQYDIYVNNQMVGGMKICD